MHPDVKYAVSGSFPSISFSKTGAEIGDAVTKRTAQLNDTLAALQAEIVEVAKRRDVNPDEVLADLAAYDADDFGQTINKYETAFSNTVSVRSSQVIVEALTHDLGIIRNNFAKIHDIRNTLETLQRVVTNLHATDMVRLTYNELVQLGF